MTILLLYSHIILSELYNTMLVLPHEYLYRFMVYKNRLQRWILGPRGRQ